MNKSLGPSSIPSKLSDPIQRRLNMYALAASAAGIGMLASPNAAEAKIVYTPTNVQITPNNGFVNMDVNNDGTPDFGFYNYFIYGSCCFNSRLMVTAEKKANKVVAIHNNKRTLAADLGPGFQIGPKLAHGFFQPGTAVMADVFYRRSTNSKTSFTSYGQWRNVTNRYLGLKFLIKGKVHYGWARLTVKVNREQGYGATLTGYAYETIANKPIVAGKKHGPDEGGVPASANSLAVPVAPPERAGLGLLAWGAPGLSVWRREESDGIR
jgi:hypothetical protein